MIPLAATSSVRIEAPLLRPHQPELCLVRGNKRSMHSLSEQIGGEERHPLVYRVGDAPNRRLNAFEK